MQAHTEERFENRSWSVFQSVAGVAPPPPLVATRNLPTHSLTCSDVSGMLRVAGLNARLSVGKMRLLLFQRGNHRSRHEALSL